jgi:hypothetical protein
MPIYLIAAYKIFSVLPLALAISITVRRQRIERKIVALEAQLS